MKNVVKGFVTIVHSIKEAFDRTYNDQYVCWDEWQEVEKLAKVRMGL